MPFPQRLLTDGEEVVLELHPHWVVLVKPFVWTVLVLAATVGIVVRWPHGPIAVLYVLLAILAVNVLWLLARVLRRQSTNIVITTTRLIRRTGILGRSGLELRLERINELSYRQTLIGRLVGEGRIEAETGGESGVVVFEHVAHPASVQSLVTEQISMARRRMGWAMGGPGGPLGASSQAGGPTGRTVADQLVDLDELRQRGILTDAEFEDKKRDLLGRI